MSDPTSDPRANVILNSLAVFAPGVSEEQRENVVLANLWAQKVAREEFSSGLNPDWFSNYRRTLSYLGWDAAKPWLQSADASRDRLVDEALEQIARAGQKTHVDITQLAVQALAKDSKARTLFESNARIGKATSFMLLPCVQHSGASIDMVLYHLEMESLVFDQRALFLSNTGDIKISKQRVELVRFNSSSFRDDKRNQVFSRLTAANRKAMVEVQLRRSGNP